MEDIVLNEDGRVVLPKPEEISQKAKDDAMGAYLMMFAAWGLGLPLPFLGLIASTIYYFINNKESRFAAFNAYQSLLLHLGVSILNAAVIIWGIVAWASPKIKLGPTFFIFLIFTILWNLIYMVFSIIACMKARKGRFYYFIFIGRIAFNKFYNKKAQTRQARIIENLPPKGF